MPSGIRGKTRNESAEYYRELLGVIPPFDLKQLKSSYYRRMKEWHPDVFVGDESGQAIATERSKLVNLGFEFLSELLEELGGIYTLPSPGPSKSASQRTAPQQPKRQYQGRTYRAGFPDPTVIEIFLKSSHIISTGYNRITRELYIKFQGDSVYRYFSFPDSLFEEFLGAASPGRFAHRWIYHQFQYERCS